jgi:hypothetical protein
MPNQRTLVRILIGAALGLALTGSVALPLPEGLPAISLGQPGLYRLEISLAVFYGCLLIITPAYSGLMAGRLPVEISTRGAKFAEEAQRSARRDEIAAEDLERAANELREELAVAIFELDRLNADRGDRR